MFGASGTTLGLILMTVWFLAGANLRRLRNIRADMRRFSLQSKRTSFNTRMTFRLHECSPKFRSAFWRSGLSPRFPKARECSEQERTRRREYFVGPLL